MDKGWGESTAQDKRRERLNWSIQALYLLLCDWIKYLTAIVIDLLLLLVIHVTQPPATSRGKMNCYPGSPFELDEHRSFLNYFYGLYTYFGLYCLCRPGKIARKNLCLIFMVLANSSFHVPSIRDIVMSIDWILALNDRPFESHPVCIFGTLYEQLEQKTRNLLPCCLTCRYSAFLQPC